jgi:UDP-2-acetamido-2,6-beta-L-arabino-hexul-4-ose reductase
MINALITGSDGFVAKNFINHNLNNKVNFLLFNKKTKHSELKKMLLKCNILFHFAGVNRSNKKKDFYNGNILLTKFLVDNIKNNIPIIYLSTIKIDENSIYGKSKKKSESILKTFCKSKKIPLFILKLPNLFGKWSRPNYNSVVSTFCFNILKNYKIKNKFPKKKLKLLYIDDLVIFLNKLLYKKKFEKKITLFSNFKTYSVTLEKLESIIRSFKKIRTEKFFDTISSNLSSKLYSTYISFCDKKDLIYNLKGSDDKRGSFVEFFKSQKLGQISYFKISPKQIRGMHFHQSKTEKFLVIKGKVEMRFKNMKDKKSFKIILSDKTNSIVDTIPGYYHDIKNLSKQESIVLLWSNQIFNIKKPDTIPIKYEEI